MMTLNISSVAQEGFGAAASLEKDRIILRVEGVGDMTAVRPLERCLANVHEEVIRLGLRGVDIDICALYLLNSSCLKALVSFIHQIQTKGPLYAVRFVTDERLAWQARSLRVIERMAPEIVSVAALPGSQ